jgi:hypothetical protein
MTWVMKPKLRHRKQIKKNHEAQLPINLIVKEKIENKIRL